LTKPARISLKSEEKRLIDRIPFKSQWGLTRVSQTCHGKDFIVQVFFPRDECHQMVNGRECRKKMAIGRFSTLDSIFNSIETSSPTCISLGCFATNRNLRLFP
jgi:hypothetical protein